MSSDQQGIRLTLPHRAPKTSKQHHENNEVLERWAATQTVNRIVPGSGVTITEQTQAVGPGATGTGIVTVNASGGGTSWPSILGQFAGQCGASPAWNIQGFALVAPNETYGYQQVYVSPPMSIANTGDIFWGATVYSPATAYPGYSDFTSSLLLNIGDTSGSYYWLGSANQSSPIGPDSSYTFSGSESWTGVIANQITQTTYSGTAAWENTSGARLEFVVSVLLRLIPT